MLTWLYTLLAILAGAAVLWLVWRVLRALAPVVVVATIGAIIAALLGPLADRIHRAIRWRPLAALAVVLLLLAPFVLIVAWLTGTVEREASHLESTLPQQFAYANALLTRWQADLARAGVHIDLGAAVEGATNSALRHGLSVLTTAASVTTDVVLALVIAFFLILDGGAMSRHAYLVLPARWQAGAREVGRILGTVVAEYVRGQIIVGAVFGVLIGISMALLGLPYPALLGLIAGIMELVPSIGPILAGVLPVGIALAQPFPHVVWVLLTFIAAQQVESNFLVPRISGGMVGLHPLTVILAVFAGWTVAGFGGALIAVPAVAAARELLRRWWQPAMPPPLRRWPAPVEARGQDTAAAAAGRAALGPPGAVGELAPVRAEPPSPPAPAPGGRQRARSRG